MIQPRDIHIPTSQALVPDYFIYSYKPIQEETSVEQLVLPVSLQPSDNRSFSKHDGEDEQNKHDDDHSAHVLDVLW